MLRRQKSNAIKQWNNSSVQQASESNGKSIEGLSIDNQNAFSAFFSGFFQHNFFVSPSLSFPLFRLQPNNNLSFFCTGCRTIIYARRRCSIGGCRHWISPFLFFCRQIWTKNDKKKIRSNKKTNEEKMSEKKMLVLMWKMHFIQGRLVLFQNWNIPNKHLYSPSVTHSLSLSPAITIHTNTNTRSIQDEKKTISLSQHKR